MVAGRHDNSVDILAVEDLVVIAGGRDVLSENFLGVRAAPFIEVAHGHQFHSGLG